MNHPLLRHGKGSRKPAVIVQEALTDAATALDSAGVDSPRLDAEILLGKTLGLSRPQLYARLQEPINPKDLKRFSKLIDKRASRIPLQYLTGHTEFMSLDFLVKKGIFVPRPETEMIVEAVLERVNTPAGLKILDIGTGCGNIAVSIAVGLKNKNIKDIMVYASDISPKALKLARLNAKRHSVEANLSFHRGSVYKAFQGLGLEGKIDFIASNPPYVPQNEWEELQPEVRDYEDPRALVAGEDGLDCYRRIIEGAHRWLRPGGWLILELGENQADSVKDLISGDGHFEDTRTAKDLQGIERTVIAKSGQ